MTTRTAIEFKNLTLGFREKQLLTNFSAAIPIGSCTGIFGVNGAGKSTLFRALLGLIKPTSGQIHIFDQLVTQGHRDIGYLPQSKSNPTHLLTGRIYLQSVLHGLNWGFSRPTPQQRTQLEEAIELTNIQNYIDRPYAMLSGGEKQRLTLAQALLNKPKILLLDEPLSSLDPAQQAKTMELIETIQKKLNLTVLITAHDINPLLNVMDNVIYLAQGKAAAGTVSEVVNSETLSRLYDTPIEVIPWGNSLLVIHQHHGVGVANAHCHH